jgi:hypothetical protein
MPSVLSRAFLNCAITLVKINFQHNQMQASGLPPEHVQSAQLYALAHGRLLTEST